MGQQAMDASEFTALIRRHAGLIHKIAFAYCRNATDREDVVQEIAVQLWSRRYVERPGLGPRARRILDAVSGRSLRSATVHLAELASFVRDDLAP
jgi:DNA-directed RNA polymerase specialized sigma24 family protein